MCRWWNDADESLILFYIQGHDNFGTDVEKIAIFGTDENETTLALKNNSVACNFLYILLNVSNVEKKNSFRHFMPSKCTYSK